MPGQKQPKTLKAKRRGAGISSSRLVPRKNPYALSLSSDQIDKLHAAFSASHLPEEDVLGAIGLGTPLSFYINSALAQYIELQNANTNNPRRVRLHFNAFYSALKKLNQALPPGDSTLIQDITRRGDAYAGVHGPHSELAPVRHPASLGHPATEDEPPAPPNRAWTDFRSKERLTELFRDVREVSKWLDSSFEPSASSNKRMSPSMWLIGDELPEIFERIFGPKFGLSINGPGTRFVEAVLKLAQIKTRKGESYSRDAIVKARQRVLSSKH